ncbi:hypothetical protein [Haloechinothrix halophila]|uniref:hypothetical protein n=1 Tax=Haloechinothrix halophila TaxID=1069073 RepID=UPI00041C9FC2|nr:hypothetical protein [Haloechinothrix halophila]
MLSRRRLMLVAVPRRGVVAALVVLAAAALTWHLLGPHFAHASGGHGEPVLASEQHHDQSEHHDESEYPDDKHCEDAEPCPGDGHTGTCGYLLQQDNEDQVAPTVDAVWHVCGHPGRTPFTQDAGSQRSRAPPDPVCELQVIRV